MGKQSLETRKNSLTGSNRPLRQNPSQGLANKALFKELCYGAFLFLWGLGPAVPLWGSALGFLRLSLDSLRTFLGLSLSSRKIFF